MAVAEDVLTGFEGFSGQLLKAGDPGYDDARRVHNGMIDRRPALIARCLGTADVRAAIQHARESGLELSVRGGGHAVSGAGVTDGGLMLDLSLMRGIHVDPRSRTARAQGGVTWAELNRETQLHGLAVTGGVISTTGIAGLTLGGGLGWAMPKLGLAADNLISAEVVTADGRVLTASADENDDLFWGLRGGGGNFGVVTSFEYRLHEIGPIVMGGLAIHPIDAAPDLLRFLRGYVEDVSDDLMVVGALTYAPDGSGLKIAGIAVCHVGPPEAAQAELAPVLEYGAPLELLIGPMPYSAVNTMLDDGFPAGLQNYWKSAFLSEFPDEAIDAMVEQFARVPSPLSSIVLEHFHGAVSRVPVDSTAVPHRAPGINFLVAGVWDDPAASEENIAWVRGAYEAMTPFMSGLRYVNYMAGDDLGGDHARTAYGPNYDRLAKVKATYDPENVFHLNQNVPPGSA
jgi:FAD/FMN-containing dehydrogenase